MPVPFHDDTVVLVGTDGEPLVAMNPIVVNMGLDWASQYTKLKSSLGRWGIVIITTPFLGVSSRVVVDFGSYVRSD